MAAPRRRVTGMRIGDGNGNERDGEGEERRESRPEGWKWDGLMERLPQPRWDNLITD